MRKSVDIFLVEDNPNDAELAMRALKEHNLANALVHVSDGAVALDFIFAQGDYADRRIDDRPRLLLLDLKLPKADGLEVLKASKSNERTKFTPVAVPTASKEEKDLVESYRLGANSYLVKPVGFDKFVDSVKAPGFCWLLLNERPWASGPAFLPSLPCRC